MRELPKEIPLFPLQRCILVPGCNLPLQLFEPRYLQMYEDLPSAPKVIGIIQPRNEVDSSHPDLYSIGTVGEVIEARTLPNRRYAIVLRGLQRFHLDFEVQNQDVLYRKAVVSYDAFSQDMADEDVPLDRDEFFLLLEKYMKQKKIKIKIHNIKQIRNFQIVNILSQALPFTTVEKQSLLEVHTHFERMEQLTAMLTMETSQYGRISDDQDRFMN